MTKAVIRAATEADLPAINEIYNHYILNTPITFDLEPWDMEARQSWFEGFAVDPRHILLVAEAEGQVLGYAGTMEFRKKRAYQTSVETTIYLRPGAEGRGLGFQLYEALLPQAADAGAHIALAGITIPNDNSLKLHKKLGFKEVGVFSEVGHKMGRYWDVLWMEKSL